MKSWVSSFKGVVVSVKRWSDTHVEGSGGGGYVGQFGGNIKAQTISSDVVQKTELFGKDATGKESSFVLQNVNVPFREGSNVFLVWGSESGKESGQFLYIENLDTKDVYRPANRASLEKDGFSIASLFGWAFLLWICLVIIFMLFGGLVVFPRIFPPDTPDGVFSKFMGIQSIGNAVLAFWLSSLRVSSVSKKAKSRNADVKYRRNSFYQSIQASAAAVGVKLVTDDVLQMCLRRESGLSPS